MSILLCFTCSTSGSPGVALWLWMTDARVLVRLKLLWSSSRLASSQAVKTDTHKRKDLLWSTLLWSNLNFFIFIAFASTPCISLINRGLLPQRNRGSFIYRAVRAVRRRSWSVSGWCLGSQPDPQVQSHTQWATPGLKITAALTVDQTPPVRIKTQQRTWYEQDNYNSPLNKWQSNQPSL